MTDSVRRQHHISLQINDELGVHHGLLSELEHDLDGTQGRLSGARKRLDKFRKGVKGNCTFINLSKALLLADCSTDSVYLYNRRTYFRSSIINYYF